MCCKSDAPKMEGPSAPACCGRDGNRERVVQLRICVAVAACVPFVFSVFAVWERPSDYGWAGILGFWTMGPPLWFLVENSFFNAGCSPTEKSQRRFEREQDLARNVWAGVAALLVGLYELSEPDSKTLACRTVPSVAEAVVAPDAAKSRDIHWYLNLDRRSASSTQHLSCVEAGR